MGLKISQRCVLLLAMQSPWLVTSVASRRVVYSSHSLVARALISSARPNFSSEPKDCYIGLGSNLGDRFQALTTAVEELRAVGEVVCTSQLYKSAPMYILDQPAYLNAACLLRTKLTPQELLQQLKQIERKMGRDFSETAVRFGPRVIDLDILLYGDEVIRSENLTIPHCRMLEREFVLQPLTDINPDLVVPSLSASPVSECLQELKRSNRQAQEQTGAEADDSELQRVLPIRGRFVSLSAKKIPLICGILNVTPDRYSQQGPQQFKTLSSS